MKEVDTDSLTALNGALPFLLADYLEEVPRENAEESQEILDVLHESFFDKNFESRWRDVRIELVKNKHLETEYDDKKQDFLIRGRQPGELQEAYGFMIENNIATLETITAVGLQTHESEYNPIGYSRLGIYLCKHADICMQHALIKHSNPQLLRLIIFRYLTGRQTTAIPRPATASEFIEPTQGYDSHVSALPPFTTDPLQTQYDRSQVFLYEINKLLQPSTRPRQTLPYAVITFTENGQYVPAIDAKATPKEKLAGNPRLQEIIKAINAKNEQEASGGKSGSGLLQSPPGGAGDLLPGGSVKTALEGIPLQMNGASKLMNRGSPGLLNSNSPGMMNGSSQGLMHGAPTGLMNGAPTGLMNGAPTGLMNGAPTSLMNGGQASMMNGGPASMMNGGPASMMNGGPAGLMNGGPASMMNGVPTSMMNGSTSGLMNGSTSAMMNGSTSAMMNGSTSAMMNGIGMSPVSMQHIQTNMNQSPLNMIISQINARLEEAKGRRSPTASCGGQSDGILGSPPAVSTNGLPPTNSGSLQCNGSMGSSSPLSRPGSAESFLSSVTPVSSGPKPSLATAQRYAMRGEGHPRMVTSQASCMLGEGHPRMVTSQAGCMPSVYPGLSAMSGFNMAAASHQGTGSLLGHGKEPSLLDYGHGLTMAGASHNNLLSSGLHPGLAMYPSPLSALQTHPFLQGHLQNAYQTLGGSPMLTAAHMPQTHAGLLRQATGLKRAYPDTTVSPLDWDKRPKFYWVITQAGNLVDYMMNYIYDLMLFLIQLRTKCNKSSPKPGKFTIIRKIHQNRKLHQNQETSPESGVIFHSPLTFKMRS
jgi:hypothetical protein